MRGAYVLAACSALALLGACTKKKEPPAEPPPSQQYAAIAIFGPMVYIGTRTFDIKPEGAADMRVVSARAKELLDACAKEEGMFVPTDPDADARYRKIAQCAAERSAPQPEASDEATDAKPAKRAGRKPKPEPSFILVPNTP